MSRSSRRHPELFDQIRKTDSLTDAQNKLIDKLAIAKSELFIQATANLINKCYFQAMRQNRVSEARARRILEQTEILINIESRKNNGSDIY